MSEYKTDIVPDRPLNWTLASESPIKRLPNLSEMWDEWRANWQAEHDRKEKEGYYRPGQHSKLNTGNSNTLKLIEDEQL